MVSRAAPAAAPRPVKGVTVGHSYRHDVSKRLRRIAPVPFEQGGEAAAGERNPRPVSIHRNQPDTALQTAQFADKAPSPTLSFDGIGILGGGGWAPPDTNGEVGATQFVESVNEAVQVFSKTTGASVMGPVAIETLWSGFGGVCETDGGGDPVVLYDQLANRWLVSQFAGDNTYGTITDECIAVSTTSDATGSYNRYGFHLGSNFFDYPHLGVWPDGYYMSMNVFNAAGNAYLGPQPFVFDRAAMVAGQTTAGYVTFSTLNSSEEPYLPADLDGSTSPSSGAPNPFVEWPGNGTYKIYRFHVDWTTPGSSTFTLAAAPAAAGFTLLCEICNVPQLGTTYKLDRLDDRLMFRLAYRKFGDHESLVGNYTVKSSLVAGIRWFELRSVTSGTPTVYQQSTYQPDTTWRWMGSAAMDGAGDLAVGYSASSATLNPQLRYSARLATDALNTLGQGEATLYAGTGSQVGTGNRWGDYSAMSVDPVDDCTFWFASEYYSTTPLDGFAWKTRISSFAFPTCLAGFRTLSMSKAGSGSGTVSSTPEGISCTSSCSAPFALDSSVTLNATPESGSSFTGWSGDCSGTGACTVSMSAARSVTATFALVPWTLTISSGGSGTGLVTSAPSGISCGSGCTHDFDNGTSVTLTATAAGGSTFTGWAGDCSGSGTCTLTMSANHSATATFESDKTLTVSTSGDGSGSVRSDLAGIDCGTDCSQAYAYGTSVILTASARSGSTFSGWAAGCSGTGTCALTMSAARSPTAVFLARCVVPKVKGKKLAAARQALKKAHCATGTVKTAFSAKKKGSAISQSPAPGRILTRGGKVNLVVSKGKKKK